MRSRLPRATCVGAVRWLDDILGVRAEGRRGQRGVVRIDSTAALDSFSRQQGQANAVRCSDSWAGAATRFGGILRPSNPSTASSALASGGAAITSMPAVRRSPPPWQIEETDACLIVRDANRQALALCLFRVVSQFEFRRSHHRQDVLAFGASGHGTKPTGCGLGPLQSQNR